MSLAVARSGMRCRGRQTEVLTEHGVRKVAGGRRDDHQVPPHRKPASVDELPRDRTEATAQQVPNRGTTNLPPDRESDSGRLAMLARHEHHRKWPTTRAVWRPVEAAEYFTLADPVDRPVQDDQAERR